MEIEFRLIDDEQLPPVVISMNENDEPKVVINSHHRIWMSLHRRTIVGVIEALQDKMDELLTGFLREQRANEKLDMGDWE
tara:strand:- start:1065 stop:1304 length:240 start_codon:yes stop_codon:yes gene_type:complete